MQCHSLDLTTGYCYNERAGIHEAYRRLAGNQAFPPAALWPRALLYPSSLPDTIVTPDTDAKDQQALYNDPLPSFLLADGSMGMESRSGFPAPDACGVV